MLKKAIHSAKVPVALLIVGASLFCVLFGQGAHFHDVAIHIGKHFDIHAHVHAHESHEEPFQAPTDQSDDDHRHEVKTASDIIGTLTSQNKVEAYELAESVLSQLASSELTVPEPREIPFLFDLPPPRPVVNRYHLFSLTLRGPPLA